MGYARHEFGKRSDESGKRKDESGKRRYESGKRRDEFGKRRQEVARPTAREPAGSWKCRNPTEAGQKSAGSRKCFSIESK